MNRICIGNAERRLEDADSQWIHEQLEARRRDAANTCVRVEIHVDGADAAVETPNYASYRGAAREPNALEKSLFDLWQRNRLRESGFTAGDLVAFVRQVRLLI